VTPTRFSLHHAPVVENGFSSHRPKMAITVNGRGLAMNGLNIQPPSFLGALNDQPLLFPERAQPLAQKSSLSISGLQVP
jgi:hypothetical protein